MRLRKFTEFSLDSVTKIGSDPVIVIDESHYIGAFLSTTQVAPISLDGLRYNLIHGIESIAQSQNPELLNAEIYKVPNGVIDEPIGTWRPKAFRYNKILIYENTELFTRGSIIERIYIYTDSESPVAEITDISITDRLILITNTEIDFNKFHSNSRYPHRFDKQFLTQGRLQEFNTLTPLETLSQYKIDFDGILSAFSIHPPHRQVKVDAFINTSRCSQGTYSYSWDLITRVYDQPYLPAKIDN